MIVEQVEIMTDTILVHGLLKHVMKCEPERGGSCRRCRKNGTPCVFTARANARQSPTRPVSEKASRSLSEKGSHDVMARLAVIETILGIDDKHYDIPTLQAFSSESAHAPLLAEENEDAGDPSLVGLWTATANLERYAEVTQTRAWSRSVVSQLWFSFYANIEGLHFQPEREAVNDPSPILLAAILYVSALHHSSDELAALAPEYFRATCSAIAELSIPKIPQTSSSLNIDSNLTSISSQAAYQNVLGIILASLISEAFVDCTGIWISIAYRLIIDNCPVHPDSSVKRWRQLFNGLQIIDLEHASLHLSSTLVPLHAPLPSLRQSQNLTDDPFSRLTVMTHTGLSHFTSRGLPTIWSLVSSMPKQRTQNTVYSFTKRDAQYIKEWANSLDEWLVSSHQPENTAYDAIQIWRQYNLHRLLVLSIYHPARGFNLFTNCVTSAEQRELLSAARSCLRLQNDDKGIWANWDLIMITWAAILLLRTGGDSCEHDDLLLVQNHRDRLRKIKHPKASLRHLLADRLDTWLQTVNTPSASILSRPMFDQSYALFDPNIIQIVSEPFYQPGPSEDASVINSLSTSASRSLPVNGSEPAHNSNQECGNVHGHTIGTWPLGFSRAVDLSVSPDSREIIDRVMLYLLQLCLCTHTIPRSLDKDRNIYNANNVVFGQIFGVSTQSRRNISARP
ncbi:unnamed protein product [Periconia digitata]|uniref:Zn(2)-C6 fungal-type domain-containing protein n=1 Tax=Periconia digitata TaxID=1303443 RepID=A0A9W4UQW9_9PLEO|nr:unnamed protein product [Periconia digitata]